MLKPILHDNLQQLKETFGSSTDVVIREIRIGRSGNIKAALIYIEGLADTKYISDFMDSLLLDFRAADHDSPILTHVDALHILKDVALNVGGIKDVSDYEAMCISILSGDTAILVDGQAQGLIVGTKGGEDRSVTEPGSQSVVRGPRDGFTETLRTNTALIRRRIKDPRLWLETKPIGRVTRTDVAIMYIKGIVNDKIVEEVRTRLARIDIDGILESGYIEEMIQDSTYTPFPTIYNTERPDTIAAGLLEGRVAILVDGTPFVLLVPALFAQYYQAAEDHYQRADIATFLRLLRVISFLIALLGPALYIAIITFHQEMLPPPLLVSLSAQREGIPFPAFIEAMLMEIIFEILREAGVRMPKAIGSAVSIVGSIVLGQAAVAAGLVSAAMVIIVSITAITNFVIPSFNMAISIRILRFLMMGLAASFGLYGLFIGLMAITLHLTSLRSFGVPYMSPMAPFILQDQKDTIFRFPRWGLFSRPRLMSQNNVIREQTPPPKPETENKKK